MIPCGLIITELITNALKYAFPLTVAEVAGRTNEIWVNLQEVRDGQICLLIGNNGNDLPADLDLTETDTLGLKLVARLVKQLNGSLEFERNHGTVFKISFNPGKAD